MDDCCEDKASELEALRTKQSQVLWVVLGINATMFCIELFAGWLAGSLALQADSLDMLGDTTVYAVTLFAIAKSTRWRSSAVLQKGGIMAVFGLWVLGQCLYRLFDPGVPNVALMSATGLLALAANGLCLFLLTRHKSDDLNMRSTWLCSRNDIIANTGVLLAAGAVLLTGSMMPDLLVSLIITVLFMQSSWHVIRSAVQEMRAAPASRGQALR
jgi:cation diffusion facilitator family transporter